jgi:hypothetical protein
MGMRITVIDCKGEVLLDETHEWPRNCGVMGLPYWQDRFPTAVRIIFDVAL